MLQATYHEWLLLAADSTGQRVILAGIIIYLVCSSYPQSGVRACPQAIAKAKRAQQTLAKDTLRCAPVARRWAVQRYAR